MASGIQDQFEQASLFEENNEGKTPLIKYLHVMQAWNFKEMIHGGYGLLPEGKTKRKLQPANDKEGYCYLIKKSHPDLIYFLDTESKSLPRDEIWGHASMLTEEEQELANEGQQKLVVYAGHFQVNKNGEVTKWSNGSGHFQPKAKYAKYVAQKFGFPLDKFERHSAHCMKMNMLQNSGPGIDYAHMEGDNVYDKDQKLHNEALENLLKAQDEFHMAQQLLRTSKRKRMGYGWLN